MDLVGSGSVSVSSQGMAMVGSNRKMSGNAEVYTVHIGLEHSHVRREKRADMLLDVSSPSFGK